MRLLLSLFLFLCTSAPSAADFSAVDAEVEALIRRHGLPGAVLLVAKDGVQVHRYTSGSYGLDTRLPIASASKWVSASLLQRLAEQGRIDWDAPLSRYVSDLPADKSALTLRQLFALTSGIPGGDQLSAHPCLADRFTTLEACARSILELPLRGTPGTVFDYGGNAMQVAGWIVERATGEDWNLLLQRELGAPLGWTETSFAALPAFGAGANPRIAGGLFSTAPEYLQLLIAQQQYGRLDGKRLFDRQGVADGQRVQTTGTQVLSTPFAQAAGYGLGRWIDRVDSAGQALQVSSPGAFGFTPWIDTRRGIAAVLAIYKSPNGYGDTRAEVVSIQQKVAAALDADLSRVPFADFGGVWWNPAEAGSGLLLQQNAAHRLVLSWYTFADDGSPLWLIGTGEWVSASRWQGTLYRGRYQGRPALPQGLQPELASTEVLGSVSLEFSRADRGQLQLTTPQFSRSLPIEPFAF